MEDMIHEITIDASPSQVMDAITTEEGLRSWWTSDSSARPEVGSSAEFGFGNRSTVFKMSVNEIVPSEQVVWACYDGPDEWKGTVLTWSLSTQEGEQKTRLRFRHANWKSTDGDFAICNTTWGHLFVLLKQYVEGENPGPYFH